MNQLSFYDQCRSFSMQREIDHGHVIDWVKSLLLNDIVLKKDVYSIVRTFKNVDFVDWDMLMLGLKRERLINYDNSNYFMNGVICANNDGTAHYPSQEVR